MTHLHLAISELNARLRACLLLFLFASSAGLNPVRSQEVSASQAMVGAELILSATEACVSSEGTGEFVTFQIDAATLTNPTEDIVQVTWEILRNGLPAASTDYELDPAIGPDLAADWNEETTLSFTPLQDGIFEVFGEISWNSVQQSITAVQVEVGSVPETPTYIIPETTFCDLNGLLNVSSAVSTPYSLETDLCASILDRVTGATLTLPGVDCATSGANPTAVTNNFAVNTLSAGCYVVELEATNRCGSTSVEVDIDVLGTPNFGLTMTPFCEGDSDAEILSNFELDFANCDGTLPTVSESWTLDGSPTTTTSANEFPLSGGVAFENEDVVCQTIELTYELSGGESLQCVNTACADIIFFPAEEIVTEVTYPATFPPVCDGDDLEITVISPPQFSSHEWLTSPLPNEITSNAGSGAFCASTPEASNNVASFLDLDPPGVSGIIRRTTCHFADGFPPTLCVTEGPVDVQVAPKPTIMWENGVDNVTACAYETSTSLSIVIDNNTTTPSPWDVTWVVTTDNATYEIVDSIPSADILANATLSLSLADVIASCFGGNTEEVTSFDVAVSAVNQSGCESELLEGSMTFYSAPSPEAIFPVECEGVCVEPSNVNASGGLEFQWFLDQTSCDAVESIPEYPSNGICPTPVPWDLTGSGYTAYSEETTPEFCGVTCNSTVGMRLQQSWSLPNVEGNLLQCISSVEIFNLDIVPFPDLQITSESALCENLEEFSFSAVNCNDVNFNPGSEPCLACPETSCESCYSDITEITDWTYSINGGSTFDPQFPEDPLTGSNISIPSDVLTMGSNPILIQVTSYTASNADPDEKCTTTETVSFEWYEAPVIPEGGIIQPAYLCPGEEYELDVAAENPNGLSGDLCFLWEECPTSPTSATLMTSGAPCANDCDVQQGGGVLATSEATLTVPMNADPDLDLCIDLTVTDNVGCQASTSLNFDVRALPSVESVLVMEAYGTAAEITALDPPCALPSANNTMATDCAGSAVLEGEDSDVFCSNEDFLVKAQGAQGEFEEALPNGDVAYNELVYQWGVFDVANDPGLTNNLISLQNDCGYGSTPELPCVASPDLAEAASLSVYLTVTETNGCSAEFEWIEAISVFPAPCIDLTSSDQYCKNEDAELEICGPQSLAFCCEGSLEEPGANNDGCFEFALPQACIGVGGTAAGPFYGRNTYSIGDESITCTTQQELTLTGFNAPTSDLVIEDTSFDSLDSTACEGDMFTLTIASVVQGSFPLTYEWVKDPEGASTILGNGTQITLDAELEEGADCEAVHVCNGDVVVTSTMPSGLTCHDTTSWEVYIRPTPTFTLTSEGTDFCDGEQVELCATRICGVADGANEEDSWDWVTTPACDESSNSNPADNPCWSFEAVFEGDAGDASSANSKNIALTDSYGCSDETTFEYAIYELPDLGIEASHICEGENTAVTINGADVYAYAFEPQDSVLVNPAIFAPGDAVTGDSIQQVQLLTPDSGNVLVVTGTLVYPLDDGTEHECSTEGEVPVVVYPLPVIEPSLDPEAPYCEEDSVTFCDLNEDSDWVPPVYDYLTSNGESTSETSEKCFSFELLPPSTTLTVTKILNYEFDDISTTCETVLESEINVVENPDVELTSDPAICQAESATVICDIINAATGSTYSHTWSVNEGGLLSGVEPDVAGFVTNPSVGSATPLTVADPDDIVIDCEVVDENGCTSTASVTIEVVATPILEWTTPLPDEVCSPALSCVAVEVINELDPMPEIITLWANPNGGASDNCFLFQNNTPCPIVDDISATVQLVHVLDAGGTQVCESSIEDDLVVNPTPTPAFLLDTPQACFDTANAVCIGVIHDAEDYTICEDDEYAYTWFVTPVAGLVADNIFVEDANVAVPEICLDAPGTVELILEIENSYGCSQTTPAQPFTIRELPDPTLTFTQPDGICMPTTVVINATSIGASDFTMSIEDYGIFENFSSPLVLPVEFPGYRNVDFVVSKTHTTPSILGYDNDGNPITESDVLVCSVETTYVAAFEGVIPPTAAFSVLPDNTIDLSNGPVQFVNESEGQTQNIWIFGDSDQSGSSEVNPKHQYIATGEYLVELAVVNERGCTDYAEDVIRVREDLFMYVPNAFTPARGGEGGFADNLNDAWFPSIEGTKVIESYEVCVFNRSGHRVWCSQDPNHPPSEQWNGTGPEGTHLVQTGVYTWRITLKKKNGQGADIYTGYVSVIR